MARRGAVETWLGLVALVLFGVFLLALKALSASGRRGRDDGYGGAVRDWWR